MRKLQARQGFKGQIGKEQIDLDLSARSSHPLCLRRWGSECAIRLGVPDTGVWESRGDKVHWTGRDTELDLYEQPPDPQNEEGSFEYEIILLRPPSTNTLQIPCSLDGLEAVYQPPLSAEEIAEGYSRPENVVGSYAVFHAARGCINKGLDAAKYKAGKAFHIYRPRITDARGSAVWGSLSIHDGQLTIAIPDEFLQSAVYPVTVDPTFGYTSAGASTFNLAASICMAGASFIYTADNDQIVSYHVYGSGSGKTMGMAAYSIVTTPQSRLAAEVTVSLQASAGWRSTSGLTQAMVKGTTYGVAIGSRSASAVAIHYDSGSGNNRSIDGATTLPASWSHGNWASSRWSIYATYEAASSIEDRQVYGFASPMAHALRFGTGVRPISGIMTPIGFAERSGSGTRTVIGFASPVGWVKRISRRVAIGFANIVGYAERQGSGLRTMTGAVKIAGWAQRIATASREVIGYMNSVAYAVRSGKGLRPIIGYVSGAGWAQRIATGIRSVIGYATGVGYASVIKKATLTVIGYVNPKGWALWYRPRYFKVKVSYQDRTIAVSVLSRTIRVKFPERIIRVR